MYILPTLYRHLVLCAALVLVVPYSLKIWWGIQFGGLAVCLATTKLNLPIFFYLHIICMVIPYRTTKFKSANIFTMAILSPTAKLNIFGYTVFHLKYSPCSSTMPTMALVTQCTTNQVSSNSFLSTVVIQSSLVPLSSCGRCQS